MQRIHLGRVSAAVAAGLLIGAIYHSEAIAAIAAGEPESEAAIVPGQVQVSLERIGVRSVLLIPYVNRGDEPLFGPMRCRYDDAIRQDVCRSRRPSDTLFAVKATSIRAQDGSVQSQFDPRTTDAFVENSALVRHSTDKAGHPVDVSFTSHRRYTGLRPASEYVVLEGADTTFRAIERGTGTNRLQQVVLYSSVSVPRNLATGPALGYPISGVIYASGRFEWATTQSTRPFYWSVIVYFDGTRTPDAYVDGKRHRLDLRTGLATPVLSD